MTSLRSFLKKQIPFNKTVKFLHTLPENISGVDRELAASFLLMKNACRATLREFSVRSKIPITILGQGYNFGFVVIPC